jgi:hypothetical protein
MANRILYCRKCGVGYGIVKVIPTTCPSCEQATTWTTTPLGRWPFPLTVLDVQFLQSIRVKAAEDH